MKRIDAVRKIMEQLTDEIVVSSCGNISREVYHVKDRPQNFYVMGSMGLALAIGIGLAINVHRNVFVIVGDGEILMNLGTLVLLNSLNLSNLKLFILDNNCYQSTGGQKSCSDSINFNDICKNYNVIKIDRKSAKVPRIDISCSEISERFYNAINRV